MTKSEHDKEYGGVAATPEEYNKSQQQFLNIKMRDALDRVSIHPGPMIMKAVEDLDIDIESISPWRIWKSVPPAPIMTIREYVEAHTIYDSGSDNDLETLRGAEWPDIRSNFSWLNTIIFTALAVLTLYALSL